MRRATPATPGNAMTKTGRMMFGWRNAFVGEVDPAELEGEQPRRNHSGDEHRHRIDKQPETDHERVEGGSAGEGRVNADRNAKAEDEEHRHDVHARRNADLRHDDLCDGEVTVLGRNAEVALEEVLGRT